MNDSAINNKELSMFFDKLQEILADGGTQKGERDELREDSKKSEENATSLGDKLSQAGDEIRKLKALMKEARAYVDYGQRSRFVCVPAGTKPQDIRADADSLLAEIDEALK